MSRVRKLSALRFLGVALMLAGVPVQAGEQAAEAPKLDPKALNARAEGAFAAAKWDESVDLFRQLIAAEPANASAWLKLGRSLHRLGRYEDAVAPLQKADELTPSPSARAVIARCLSRTGKLDDAFTWLDKAIQLNYKNTAELRNAEDFAALRADPRFEQTYRNADKLARPCVYSPVHQQFDFWVGEWIVTMSGTEVGTNRIEKSLDGCALLEHWSASGGGTGRSLNYYDPVAGLWRQVWADSDGGSFTFSGELRDGSMFFEGEHIERDGKREAAKMTLKPRLDGTVQQIIEQTRDDEKWYVWFNGLYTPKQ